MANNEVKAEYEACVCKRLLESGAVPYREVLFANGDSPQEANCHRNVDRYVKENPTSTTVRGWMSYMQAWNGQEIKDRLTAHSVVRDVDGQLFDITPFGNNDHRETMRFVPHCDGEQEFFAMGIFIDCPIA